ncbi:unnamed protein product [Amoebophrya sp. A120]|nr:unnamed protein product [Amoebophrya sp. A120]|eukprot:GSA120T00020619001.1
MAVVAMAQPSRCVVATRTTTSAVSTTLFLASAVAVVQIVRSGNNCSSFLGSSTSVVTCINACSSWLQTSTVSPDSRQSIHLVLRATMYETKRTTSEMAKNISESTRPGLLQTWNPLRQAEEW